MGLDIILESEDGQKIDSVGDPANILHRILPSHEDISSPCLRFVDRYGDTIFNTLQMPPLLDELSILQKRVKDEVEQQLLVRIVEMARRCRDEPHLYLRFVGD